MYYYYTNINMVVELEGHLLKAKFPHSYQSSGSFDFWSQKMSLLETHLLILLMDPLQVGGN